jgi:hypothetical protein
MNAKVYVKLIVKKLGKLQKAELQTFQYTKLRKPGISAIYPEFLRFYKPIRSVII